MEQNSAAETGGAAALKLLYAISSEPFPLLTSDDNGAKLKLMVTNNSGDIVKLKGLIIKIPLGTRATDLTNNQDLKPVWPDGWDILKKETAGGFVKYSVQSKTGNIWFFPDKTSIIFLFNDVKTNALAGTVTIDVTEVSDTCTAGSNCPVASLQISKFPHSWGTVSFKAEPSVIKSLVDKTVLSWKGPAGATYTITYTEPGKGVIKLPKADEDPFANIGSYPATGKPDLKLADTTTFTLDVISTIGGTTYKAQEQKTVTTITEAPRIMQFTGRIECREGKTKVILNWITTGATTHIIGDNRTFGQNSLDDAYVIDITPQNPLRSSYTLKTNNSMGENESTLKVVWANDAALSLKMWLEGTLISPDQSKLFVCEKTPPVESSELGMKLSVYNPATLTKIAGSTELVLSSVSMEMMMGAVISPNGDFIYILINNMITSASVLKKIAISGNTLTVKSATNINGSCSQIVISPDGTKLYVLFPGEAVRVYNTGDLSPANTFNLKNVQGICLNKNGSLLYLLTINDTRSTLVQISTATFTVTLGPQEIDKARAFISSPDDEMLCVISQRGDSFSLFWPNKRGRKPAFIFISENKITDNTEIGNIVFATDSRYLFMMGSRKPKSLLNIFDTWSETSAATAYRDINIVGPQLKWQPMTLSPDGTRVFGFISTDRNLYTFKPASFTGGVTSGIELNPETNHGTN